MNRLSLDEQALINNARKLLWDANVAMKQAAKLADTAKECVHMETLGGKAVNIIAELLSYTEEKDFE